MMIILQPPMKYTETHHICLYHKQHPHKKYAGCTCSGSYGAVVKPLEEWTDAEKRGYFGEQ